MPELKPLVKFEITRRNLSQINTELLKMEFNLANLPADRSR
jgi:hypothetical protein